MELILPLLLVIITSVILFAMIIIGLFYTLDLFLEIPYVGTTKKDKEIIIGLAAIKPGTKVLDLGSGDGRLLIQATKNGATCIGYELNPLLFFISKLKIKLNHLEDKIKINYKSVWHAKLKNSDVIIVYAKKSSMEKFEKFIFKNANKRSRIIVNTNPFPNKNFRKKTNNIFLYII